MVIIKRYSNRKLYNTNEKQYVTLERIAELIRNGEDIQVTDHETGEDLTAMTFAQIIFEQEKKGSGTVSQGVLARLIKAGGDTVESLRRTISPQLEAARTFNTEVENRIHSLIKRNEINAEEGKNLIEKLLSVGAPPPPVEDDIPTRDDILKLSAQIDALTKEIESLEAEQEE